MNSVAIITSYINGDLKELLNGISYDYVICADGGYDLAKEVGITPDLVIGDFDSGNCPGENGIEVIKLPCEKDDTDTLYCIKYAIARGAKYIYVIGGLGGRVDHSIANFQSLAYAAKQGIGCRIIDRQNQMTMLANDEETIKKHTFSNKAPYNLSIFSYSPICEHVSIKGVKYELDDATLRNDFPIGVSNEFEDEYAKISMGKGQLLIVFSKDLK